MQLAFMPDKLDELTRDELIGLVRKLREEIERLSKMLQELQRKSPRQANPFSKNRPQADPNPPGRKPGQGRCPKPANSRSLRPQFSRLFPTLNHLPETTRSTGPPLLSKESHTSWRCQPSSELTRAS
jgi:hypothetical protein